MKEAPNFEETIDLDKQPDGSFGINSEEEGSESTPVSAEDSSSVSLEGKDSLIKYINDLLGKEGNHSFKKSLKDAKLNLSKAETKGEVLGVLNKLSEKKGVLSKQDGDYDNLINILEKPSGSTSQEEIKVESKEVNHIVDNPLNKREFVEFLNKVRQKGSEQDLYWHVFGRASENNVGYPASLVGRADLLERFSVGRNGQKYSSTRSAAHDLLDYLAEDAERGIRNNEVKKMVPEVAEEVVEEVVPNSTIVPSEVPENLETGIPMMITRKLRSDLEDIGFTDGEINRMTPKEAWDYFKRGKNNIVEPDVESTDEEKIILGIGDIKEMIVSQLGSRAKIEKFDISENNEGLYIDAILDAGLLGGKIKVNGLIVNEGDGLTIKDLKIEARGYVKSMIENNLSKFGTEIREYFERKYDKPISSINIEGSNLVLVGDNS